MMNKILLLICLSLMINLGGFAQNNKRTSAYMYNNNKEYAKAKEAIDEAVVHEKTINDPKTWLYCGEIYYNIAVSDDPAVQALSPDPAQVSFDALVKAKSLDAKGTYKNELTLYFMYLTNYFYTRGSNAFQDGDYNKAIKDFENAYMIAESDGRFDTIAAFNIGMAGVLSDQPEIASKYLQKCVDVNFQNPAVYTYYNRSVKQEGDTARAFEIIAMGRERFPQELSLLLEEAQMYLETGQNDKLQESLKSAIVQDPENANLYFLLGKTYDDQGDIVNAEKYYKQAGEINPEFFEAFYNIGALYVNKAATYQMDANDLPLEKVKEYNALIDSANAQLEIAVPYLEAALEIKPDDIYTITALKDAYVRLKMNDKLEKLNK